MPKWAGAALGPIKVSARFVFSYLGSAGARLADAPMRARAPRTRQKESCTSCNESRRDENMTEQSELSLGRLWIQRNKPRKWDEPRAFGRQLGGIRQQKGAQCVSWARSLLLSRARAGAGANRRQKVEKRSRTGGPEWANSLLAH